MSTDWILVSESWRGVERLKGLFFFSFLCFLAMAHRLFFFSFFLFPFAPAKVFRTAISSVLVSAPRSHRVNRAIYHPQGVGGGLGGGPAPSQVLGVNIYCLLVSFARFAHAAVLKLAPVCASVPSVDGAVLLLLLFLFFLGGETGGGGFGGYRCKGRRRGNVHSNSSFVIFARWTDSEWSDDNMAPCFSLSFFFFFKRATEVN